MRGTMHELKRFNVFKCSKRKNMAKFFSVVHKWFKWLSNMLNYANCAAAIGLYLQVADRLIKAKQ